MFCLGAASTKPKEQQSKPKEQQSKPKETQSKPKETQLQPNAKPSVTMCYQVLPCAYHVFTKVNEVLPKAIPKANPKQSQSKPKATPTNPQR